MEDSEKRKQMLKAMRMEAAAQNDDGSTGLETSGDTAHLSNPLAETSTHQQDSCETPRFDYYTDPMSAYSSFKRNKTPKQQYVSSPHHQTSSPVPPPQFPPSVPEIPDMGNNRFGGRGSYNNTAPQFSHYGRQNSNWVGNTYPNSGRGRSRGRGMNTSFGRDGGRRPMELGAERFYSNSMAEDPWKYLKPVLWKGCSDACSSNSTSQSWLPNSIAPKKSVNSEASHKASNNQQSLAEYLAASLDEATGDESSN
ncbi:hypothetical protein CARUB_v10006986mg [Capsella rubella]|uniref:Uncharacterized protein n=1 Tax=Capsella rubella TaxID=81985 RepID=R0F925_9BRAS|nr:hypothetical protein CARUB_v10006986mg [Capsella rubella]